MNGWVVLGYLACGAAGGLAFLRLVIFEIMRQEEQLARRERELRYEREAAREIKSDKDDDAESMKPVEPVLVRPYEKLSAADLN